jgi:cytochrome c peroxidase
VTFIATLTACSGADDQPTDSLPQETDTETDDPTASNPLGATPYNYADIDLPAHFQSPFVNDADNTPANNPTTNDGAALGRVLFYDKALSKNQTITCASCHSQESGFSDTKDFSVGFDGGLTGRSSMGLTEARFYRRGRFFWDERAATLEEQVLMPIQNEVEMGLTLDELSERVASKEYYPKLFERAFGDPSITTDRISKAMAQFVRSMVSYRTRFDEGLTAASSVEAPFPSFTPEENQGKALFLGKAGCAACHLDEGPPQPGPRRNQAIFFINVPVNNGLDAGPVLSDSGVGDITGNAQDDGRFKSPSLRNVALTAPYMHDGRFATLEEVIEHYNSGVKAHPNLDPRLRVPPPGPPAPRKLNLSQAEKDALVAFLEALTDDALVTDPKFSNPFVGEAP